MILGPQAQDQGQAKDDRCDHDYWDGEADAGERRADRQVHAALDAVRPGGTHRGPRLRQQDQGGDHDADHGTRRVGRLDRPFDGG
jgi:hypothetical protein